MISKEKIKLENIEDDIYIYTITNDNVTVKLTNYGGTILSIYTPDKNGRLDDLVLGHEDINEYTKIHSYFGATIGRYANRISKGKIVIEDKEYELYKNDGKNHLHGGKVGFNLVVWESKINNDDKGDFVELSYLSKDGEENYPGNLNIKVIFRLSDNNELSIEYIGKTDETTIVNLTNHSYFNLAGHNNGDILKHRVKILSNSITENDENSIPTGVIRNIKGTVMDFNEFKEVGKDINSSYDQIKYAYGYDHNYIVNAEMNGLKKVAEVIEDISGRKMEVYTTKPGVQFYTGNFVGNSAKGKEGAIYRRNSGLCLETQYYPDSLNNSNFPSVILKPEEEYKHTTIYKFSCI